MRHFFKAKRKSEEDRKAQLEPFYGQSHNVLAEVVWSTVGALRGIENGGSGVNASYILDRIAQDFEEAIAAEKQREAGRARS